MRGQQPSSPVSGREPCARGSNRGQSEAEIWPGKGWEPGVGAENRPDEALSQSQAEPGRALPIRCKPHNVSSNKALERTPDPMKG